MENVEDIIKEFEHLPKFEDGRINYKESSYAPVFSCFLFHKEKILLLKRSMEVGAYKGKWNGVTSYIDQNKKLNALVLKELKEEVGLEKKHISSLTFYNPWQYTDTPNQREWKIYPIRATCDNEPPIKLNWENTAWKWIHPHELLDHEIVPKIDIDLDIIFGHKDWRKNYLKDNFSKPHSFPPQK